MIITPIYAAILALVFLALSIRTALARRRYGVAVGDADKVELRRAIRVHANFAEYVPLTLLLIFFVESLAGSLYWIHTLCILLLIGRLSHAYGVSQVKEKLLFRIVGMTFTFAALAGASLRIIILYLLP